MIDIKAAIEAGQRLASAEAKIETVSGIPVRNGQPLVTLLELVEQRADWPWRRKGTATFTELASFLEHVNRFKSGSSAVFADVAAVRLTAVLNYHPAGAESDPAWGDHRSVYACPLSAEWQRWTKANGVPMGQETFGQWIEDNMPDLAAPADGDDLAPPARLLEVARNLIVRTKGEFSRTVNPTTGEFSLVNKLENESQSTKIPRGFCLGIPVFEAGERYRIEARLRFSMRDGKPTFAYELVQPAAVLRDAFGGVRGQVATQTGLPVLAGSPE